MKKDKIEWLFDKVCNVLHLKFNTKTRKLLIQIFKFGIVGGIATVIDFVFLYIFREFCHFPVLVSNTLSFCISVIYNYIASVRWVFDVNKEKDARNQFVIFIVFSVLGLLLNNAIMWITVDFLSIYYLLAKVVATVIVMIFNFVTRKMFLE